MVIKKGTRVQHRAWFWMGTVIKVPEKPTNLSIVSVKRDDGNIEDWSLISLITNINDFVYDWSDEDETIEKRTKGKSKKSKHKR